MALLKAEKLSKVFGGLKAVSKFEMEINEGELIGLIGPNGAGKTTAFNLLTGVYVPTTGTIEFDGKIFISIFTFKEHGFCLLFMFCLYPKNPCINFHKSR